MRGSRWMMGIAVAMTVLACAAGAEAQRRRQPNPPAGGGAAAQPAAAQPSAQARQRARDLYAQGQTQFRAGQYVEAQASFEGAYREVPNPVVLLGVAECQERRQDWTNAAATLERYLTERADAPDRAAVQARIDAARAHPGTLNITSTPSGAAISVDGTATGRTTPASVEVAPGDHTIVLSLANHDDATQSVSVTFAATQDVTATLTEHPAETTPTPALGSESDIFGGGGEGAGGGEPPPEDHGEAPAPSYTAAKIFAGIGGAALVAGTVLGFLALSEQSDFDAMPTDATADRGERLALFADVAFAVAAGSLITGIILYLTEDGGDVEAAPAAGGGGEVSLLPVVGEHGGGAAARIRF